MAWPFGRDKTAENEARRARQEEAARRANVAEGIRQVNQTFARLVNPNADTSAIERAKTTPGRATIFHAPEVNEYWLHPTGTGSAASRAFPDRASAENALAALRVQQAGLTPMQPNYAQSSFLDALQQSYLDFATPEIQRQAGQTQRQLRQGLARRGNLESSVGAEKSGEIDRQRAEALARVAARGQEIRAQRASDIEKARLGIISQLEATANTGAAANAAINATQNLRGTQEFKPLGKMFDVALSTGADVLRQQSMPGATPTIFSRSKRGSSKTIA